MTFASKLLLAVSVFVGFFASASAHADPFDDFVGSYVASSAPQIRNVNAPTCNRYDFQELQSFDVIADRTGFRQTHVLKMNIPNGYSTMRVVPAFKDPSELDPSIGTYGASDGDEKKAWTETGWFGTNKNESVKLVLTATATGTHLAISNELKKDDKTVTTACYYDIDLVKKLLVQ